MAFKDTFCSSPWIHMRISNQGDYGFCRWQRTKANIPLENIYEVEPIEYFQKSTTMRDVRRDMLDGKAIPECESCYAMERSNKVSGREKQLLKTGIVLDNFEKTFIASPYYKEFTKHPATVVPVDWLVALGNFCNGACIFCTPNYSSLLASEFLKVNLITTKVATTWCNDKEALQKFTDAMVATPKLAYLHFIGGETLITPAFKHILKVLIANNMTDISIGLTTNLMVWNDDINALLVQFKTVNLGLSIETLCHVNDYARYPSKINSVRNLLDKWVEFGKKHNWLIQLRITPTWITVEDIDRVFEYAYINNIGVESSDFLHKPEFMRMTVLPENLRKVALARIENWIASKNTKSSLDANTRHPDRIRQQLLRDANSYLTYLLNAPYEPELLPALISYLSVIEANRNISILTYKPHYGEFLRSAGYQPNCN